MAVAANLEEAARFALSNVSEKQQLGSDLIFLCDAFLGAFFPIFADGDEAQRTVLNWGIPFIQVRESITTVLAQQENQVPDLGDVLTRTMFAGDFAQTAGRISTTQGTVLLAVYNAVWA